MFKELCTARYSCRNYTDRPIEEEKLRYIMECVRLAPSAVNRQPWRFIVIKDQPRLDLIYNAYARGWIRNAPVIVVCLADRQNAWVRPSDGKNHADIDLAILADHLTLAAADMGLATCWVCNFDAAMLSNDFNLDADYKPVILLPLGAPATDDIPEKKRKDVSEFVEWM